jgi:hypothetical protein
VCEGLSVKQANEGWVLTKNSEHHGDATMELGTRVRGDGSWMLGYINDLAAG